MRTRTQRLAIAILAFAVTFTSLPMMTEGISAHAVSTPAKVKTFNATPTSSTVIRLTWKRPGKNSGYVIYRNGKYLRRVGKTWTAYNVPSLKPATSYKFSIKAYNTYKQKQYYNSKKKRWQNSKPRSSQWRGRKTRRITAYKYSKASVVRTAATGPANIASFKCTNKTSNSATLTWKKQSAQLTGYVVYRNGKKVKTLGKNIATFTDTNLKPTTYYYYQVRAYRSLGSGKYVYGNLSAKCNVTTKAAIEDKDLEFTNASLLGETNVSSNGGEYEYTIKSNGDVTWRVNDPDVAEITSTFKSSKNTTRVVALNFKKMGAVTLTATSALNGKSKTLTMSVDGADTGNSGTSSEGSGSGTGPQGIETPYGTIYPSEDGSFTVINDYNNANNWNSTPVKINGIESDLAAIEYLPERSVIRISIDDMNSTSDVSGLVMGRAYCFGKSTQISSSNKMVVYAPQGGPFFYMVGPGTADVTIGNRTYVFSVSGSETKLYEYLAFVAAWAAENSSGTALNRANVALSKAQSYSYSQGQYGNACALYAFKNGDCTAGAEMVRDLCEAIGIESSIYNAYVYGQSSSKTHVNIAIKIGNKVYWANATPEHGTLPFSEWTSTNSPL